MHNNQSFIIIKNKTLLKIMKMKNVDMLDVQV